MASACGVSQEAVSHRANGRRRHLATEYKRLDYCPPCECPDAIAAVRPDHKGLMRWTASKPRGRRTSSANRTFCRRGRSPSPARTPSWGPSTEPWPRLPRSRPVPRTRAGGLVKRRAETFAITGPLQPRIGLLSFNADALGRNRLHHGHNLNTTREFGRAGEPASSILEA